MANLMKKAAVELQRKNQQIQNFRRKRQDDEKAMVNGAVGFVAAASGGLIDSKWGDNGPADVVGVPTNAALGAVLLGAALIPGLPARGLIASAGAGFANVAVYRYIVDNVQFDE